MKIAEVLKSLSKDEAMEIIMHLMYMYDITPDDVTDMFRLQIDILKDTIEILRKK